MEKHTRKGFGSLTAKKAFDLYPGPWEVTQLLNNKPADRFWQNVIDKYTNGKYSK